MKCKTNLSIVKSAALLVGVVISLAGCGGSGGSNSSSSPSGGVPAKIVKNNGAQSLVPSYQIVVLSSGVSTYTIYTTQAPGQQTTQTGEATLPASLTSKFFQDLAAASPLSKLPSYTGGVSSLIQFRTVEYEGQQAEIGGTENAQAQTLADDATAIAQALGLPADAL